MGWRPAVERVRLIQPLPPTEGPIRIAAARNELESFQLLIRTAVDLPTLTLKATD